MALASLLKIEEYKGRRAVIGSEDFRDAMRELASGVTLVTSVSDGRRSGCAVSSVVSLSLSPASLLVCLSLTSSTLSCIRASGVFAVNVLSSRQQTLAQRFSSAGVHGEERFAEGDWAALETGAPSLRGALAVVDCRVDRLMEHASHAVLIGSAVALASGGPGSALVHWRSRFGCLA